MAPTHPKTPLFRSAATAAEKQVQRWMRSVLREVALQSLADNLAVAVSSKSDKIREENGTSERRKGRLLTITVSSSAVENARRMCQRVAEGWSQKLQQAGHIEAADWLRLLVLPQGLPTLFRDECDHHDKGSSVSKSNMHKSTRFVSHGRHGNSDVEIYPTTEQQQNNQKSQSRKKQKIDDCVTNYARLRRLAERSVLAPDEEPPLALDRCLQQLDEWGVAGQTDWLTTAAAATATTTTTTHNTLLSSDKDTNTASTTIGSNAAASAAEAWNYVQKAAADIPARLLHRKELSTRTGEEAGEMEKGRTDTDAQQQQREERKSMLLNLKRKSVSRIRAPPKRPLAPGDLVRTSAAVVRNAYREPPDEPRSPDSANGTGKFSMARATQELGTTERQRLRAYLHENHNNSDDDNNSENSKDGKNDEETNPPMMLLGALRDIGRFHYWNQHAVDNGEDDAIPAAATTVSNNDVNNNGNSNNPIITTLSHEDAKKRTRRQKQAIQERLGDHVDPRDPTEHYRQLQNTRVMRTAALGLPPNANIGSKKGSGDGQEKQQLKHWIDFDLGHCLLEVATADPTENGDNTNSCQKKFLAFSSLEVMLLDEDKYSTNT